MYIDSNECTNNYPAVERALSIALCEMCEKEKKRLSYKRLLITSEAYVSPHFLNAVMPVVLKYITPDSVENCIKSSLDIAVARKMRDWSWWSVAVFLTSILFFSTNRYISLIIFLVLQSFVAIVFLSRNIVAKIWNNRPATKEADSKAIEEMIELCKKGRFKICKDYFFNR